MKPEINIIPVWFLADRTPPQAVLNTPLQADQVGVFSFFDEKGLTLIFKIIKPPTQSAISLPISKITARTFNVLYAPYGGTGFWFNAAFSYADGMTDLPLIEPPGATLAPTHQVGGVCQHDGTPF
ncbi:MAG: hypothetical protein RPR40_03705, partial [Bermanella sp.]